MLLKKKYNKSWYLFDLDFRSDLKQDPGSGSVSKWNGSETLLKRHDSSTSDYVMLVFISNLKNM